MQSIARLFLVIIALNVCPGRANLHGQESPVKITAVAGGIRLVTPASSAPGKLGHHVVDGLKKAVAVVKVDQSELNKEGINEALSLSVFDQPRNTWDASISVKSDVAIEKGESVSIGFWVRGLALDKSGEPIADDGGVVEIVFENRNPPHTKSVQFLVETEPGNAWKHYWVRCKSKESYAAGNSSIGFQVGYRRQQIELAGVEIWKYPATQALESLPMSPRSYIGREPDAPWRAAANQRIEKYRKCDLTIEVLDANGDPVADQDLKLVQTKHAFRFGTAVSKTMIGRQDDDGQKYREHLERLFTVGTIENGLKWQYWDKRDAKDHAKVLSAVDWLNDHDIAVRGHVMVWPAQKNSPPWITSLYDKPEVLKKVVHSHIREMAYATKGRVGEWDVLNEAFDNREFEKHLGPECFAEFFREAEGVLPDTDLYYNDYAGLVRAGVNTYHKDHFEMIIQRLLDAKAPIDGIGIQGHFGEILTPPHRIVRELDRWGKFDLKVMITEFDVNVPDEELMADFTADFLTACFSHPAVDGVVAWGFWAGSHWRPESAFFDRQWNPTAWGKRWVDLTENQWKTRVTTPLDPSGAAIKLRVFKGDYEVRVGEQMWKVSATEDKKVTLQMK